MREAREIHWLPYQRAWLQDKSPVKLWEKSRRIGATYVQAFEDVMDCLEGNVPAVYYSSADESSARKYMEQCANWARLLNSAVKETIVNEYDIAIFRITFPNGTEINALSSNPKQFRSKGGKVVLDEFAFHERADELWGAAQPAALWHEGKIRIISTHNGKQSLFHHFVEEIKKGNLDWSLHNVNIHGAVNLGLLDRIMGRETTHEERQAWLEELRVQCVDEFMWRQEYCCEPVDEATAFLPSEMIKACEKEGVLKPVEGIKKGNLYLGMDVGRHKDLSVIWLLEKVGEAVYTRAVKVMDYSLKMQ